MENQFRLIDAACTDRSCELSDERTGYVVLLSNGVEKVCTDTDTNVLVGLKREVYRAAAASPNIDATHAAGRRLELAQKVTEIPADEAPSLAPASAMAGAPPGLSQMAEALAPRVYVQIAEEAQRAGAIEVIMRLNEATLNHRSVRGLGPDLVSVKVRRTELRCVTKADCALAPDLAAYLSSMLERAVPVSDISARYEGRTRARPFHYELWFAPGDIPSVRAKPGATE